MANVAQSVDAGPEPPFPPLPPWLFLWLVAHDDGACVSLIHVAAPGARALTVLAAISCSTHHHGPGASGRLGSVHGRSPFTRPEA